MKSLQQQRSTGQTATHASTLSGTLPSWADIANGAKPNEDVSKMISIHSVEQSKLESKAKKVVIFGLAEKQTASESVAKEHDEQQLKRIFKEIGHQNAAVTYSKRLKTKNPSKFRPIVVEFKTKENRNDIISASKRLREKPEFKDVYINPDLTYVQRQFDKVLRKERDDKNAKLSTGSPFRWGIRGNQVVKVSNKQH